MEVETYRDPAFGRWNLTIHLYDADFLTMDRELVEALKKRPLWQEDVARILELSADHLRRTYPVDSPPAGGVPLIYRDPCPGPFERMKTWVAGLRSRRSLR